MLATISVHLRNTNTLNADGQAVVHSFNCDPMIHMLPNSPQSTHSTVFSKKIKGNQTSFSLSGHFRQPKATAIPRPPTTPVPLVTFESFRVDLIGFIGTTNFQSERDPHNRMTLRDVNGMPMVPSLMSTCPSPFTPYTHTSASFINHFLSSANHSLP
jgi:hypothetical protein